MGRRTTGISKSAGSENYSMRMVTSKSLSSLKTGYGLSRQSWKNAQRSGWAVNIQLHFQGSHPADSKPPMSAPKSRMLMHAPFPLCALQGSSALRIAPATTSEQQKSHHVCSQKKSIEYTLLLLKETVNNS
jgi:hypothetical protein